MSSKLTATQINHSRELIDQSKNIVITSHKNPDGDAVGSALALYLFLKSQGKNVTAILPDGAPEFLQWLPDYNEIIIFDQDTEKANDAISKADLIFSLDYNHLGRVGVNMQNALIKATANFILIDHHQQPGDFAKVTYSDTSACSTCEMIYHFIAESYGKSVIDIPISTCIYCGIMTDSGSFRFPSVSQSTHNIVGELIALGLDHALVHREVYDTNLLDRLKLVGYALSEKLEVITDCDAAIIWLTMEELKLFNHRQGDTESLVNQALSIKGIKLAVFVRESSNEIKLSFRSKGNYDVNLFAKTHWQGGGHINASGGASYTDMPTTLAKLKHLIHDNRSQITAS